MINEEKVRLMTKLALYEDKTGKQSLKANKYYKKDYIGINMINTGLTITFAYFMMVLIWIVSELDYFMEKIVSINLLNLGKQIIIIYLIVLVLYMLISYVVYSVKYRNMGESNLEYAENLKKLHIMYKRLEKNKNEAKTGGEYSDDETFGF